MSMRTVEEYAAREKMTGFIEGSVGIYTAVWNEWPTDQIELLYNFVKVGPEKSK